MAARIGKLLRKLPLEMGKQALEWFINRELLPWAAAVNLAALDHAARLENALATVEFGHFICRPLQASTSFQKMYVWSWTDEKVPASAGRNGTSAVTEDEWKSGGAHVFSFFRHDQDDELQFDHQMPHEWAGTAVKLHVHGLPASSPSGTQHVLWEGEYWAGGNGDVVPSDTAWTTFSSANEVGAADTQEYLGIATLTAPSPAKSSTQFLFNIRRAGTDPSDTFTVNKTWGQVQANYAVQWFDLHYQRFLCGSEEEYAGAVTTNPSVLTFDPGDYSGPVVLEVVVQCDAGNSVGFELYDEDAGIAVPNSEVSTSSTTPVILRTPELTLLPGARKYWIRGKYYTTADEPKLFKARFVIGPPTA